MNSSDSNTSLSTDQPTPSPTKYIRKGCRYIGKENFLNVDDLVVLHLKSRSVTSFLCGVEKIRMASA